MVSLAGIDWTFIGQLYLSCWLFGNYRIAPIVQYCTEGNGRGY